MICLKGITLRGIAQSGSECQLLSVLVQNKSAKRLTMSAFRHMSI